MKCKYDLVSYLKGESSSVEQEEVQRHLAECQICQRELEKIKKVLATLGAIEEVEPSADFTRRVMREVDKRMAPSLGERILYFLAQLRQITRLREFKLYLRHAPAWAISTTVHLVLFTIFAFILISPTRQQLKEAFIIKWTAPDEKMISTTERPEIPWDTGEIPRDTELVEEPGFGGPIPSAESPGREWVSRPPVTKIPLLPHWPARVPSIERLDIPSENRFLEALLVRAEPRKRQAALRKYGGRGTEKAVRQGLKWLARTIQPDGAWDVE